MWTGTPTIFVFASWRSDTATAGWSQLYVAEAVSGLPLAATLAMTDANETRDSSAASPWRFPVLAGRLALGGIFVYAAYAKVHFDGQWHLHDYYFFFAMAIDSYRMLPLTIVEWMARVLPWIELGLGALLLIGLGDAMGWPSRSTIALLVVFMAAMARAKMLGLEINCGCFGNRSENLHTELLLDSGLPVSWR